MASVPTVKTHWTSHDLSVAAASDVAARGGFLTVVVMALWLMMCFMIDLLRNY